MQLLSKTSLIFVLMFSSLLHSASGDGPYLREAEIKEVDGIVTISANSPRPLEQAVTALHKKYGWIVDYEDPQFVSKMDVANDQPGNKQLLPSGGLFQAKFPASPTDPAKTLQLIVDAYNASENPGKFELRKGEEEHFFMVGLQAHNVQGKVAVQHAPLDTVITIAGKKRTLAQTVTTICQAITAKQHIAIKIGILPRTVAESLQIDVSGNRVAARELLLRAIVATHHRLYWRLLYDPATNGYLINLHLLPT